MYNIFGFFALAILTEMGTILNYYILENFKVCLCLLHLPFVKLLQDWVYPLVNDFRNMSYVTTGNDAIKYATGYANVLLCGAFVSCVNL